MPSFGRKSTAKLATVDEGIRLICHDVIPHYDFTVIWGLRGKDAQNHCHEIGTSSKEWPDSKHNVEDQENPGFEDPDGVSLALDFAPWFTNRPHIRWDHEREFVHLAGYLMQAAAARGIRMRWGGDWDKDHDLYDVNRPFDLGHVEILNT